MAAYHRHPFDGYETVPAILTPGPGFPRATQVGRRPVPRGDRLSSVSGVPEERTMIPPTMEGIQYQRESMDRRLKWGTKVHWFLPTAMVFLLIAGVCGAFVHHHFYATLDGEEAEDQLMMIRYGTALAFFTKASLVGAVVLAYRQRIWFTMRQKSITLKGIDSLFAVVEDPTRFASKEMLTKAKLAAVMALATWLIPIASVLSPASLTAQPAEVSVDTDRLCTVPSLNFSLENIADWRRPAKGRFGHSLSFFNTTPPQPQEGLVWFDQPSFVARKLQTLSTLSGGAIKIQSPCVGKNCTWAIEFEAPWYNCTPKGELEAAGQMPKFLNYTFRDLAPVGNKVYFAGSDVPEYVNPQPGYNNETLDKQGIFYNEPAIWFGYVFQTGRRANDSGVIVPPGSRGPAAWTNELLRYAMRCEMQKADYKVNFTFVNNVQKTNVTISNGRPAFQPASPSNGFRPTDPGYKEFLAYHSLGVLVRGIVAGHVKKENSSDPPVTSTQLSQTRLLNQSTSFTVPEFHKEFQSFFQEIVLSLLSEPYLEIGITQQVNCTRTMYQNRYRYERQGLWVGYAISVAIALMSIITGGISIYSNGITSDTIFSRILVTTRNPNLDKLIEQYEGVCHGGDPVPPELLDTKLRFGVMDDGETDGGRAAHAAFGIVGETIPILPEHSYKRISIQSTEYLASKVWAGDPQLPGSGGSYPMFTTRGPTPV